MSHGQHVAGGRGGGGPILTSAGEDQGDHDELPQGDRGEYPEVPEDREGDLPRVQGRRLVPAGGDVGRGLHPVARSVMPCTSQTLVKLSSIQQHS